MCSKDTRSIRKNKKSPKCATARESNYVLIGGEDEQERTVCEEKVRDQLEQFFFLVNLANCVWYKRV